uniref:Uncharacterized protein n=1 Tax=Anas platyrhynchos TaxID=8839 RepID=A0A8B9SH40_ANAPL
MLARDIFRVAHKQRTRRVRLHVGLRKGSPGEFKRTWRVQLHVGLHKGSPGEFTCTQSLPLRALLDGPRGIAMRFLRPAFSVFSLCVKAEGPVSCGAGPVAFQLYQILPLGALLDGPRGIAMRFLRPAFSVFSHCAEGYI